MRGEDLPVRFAGGLGLARLTMRLPDPEHGFGEAWTGRMIGHERAEVLPEGLRLFRSFVDLADAKDGFFVEARVGGAVDPAVGRHGLVEVSERAQRIAEKEVRFGGERGVGMVGDERPELGDGIGIFGETEGGEGDAELRLGGVPGAVLVIGR
jgi:hypothetical protein